MRTNKKLISSILVLLLVFSFFFPFSSKVSATNFNSSGSIVEKENLVITEKVYSSRANDPKYYAYLGAHGFFKHALYVKGGDFQTVVYCFNASKTWPGLRDQLVNRIENASRDEFLRYASNPRNSETLDTDVKRVCYKGFPRNGTGIKEKYNLADDEFRFLTQMAVWYYTDSMTYTKPAIYWTYSYIFNRSGRLDAYNELISSEQLSLPSQYTLDLYHDNSGSKMQNLLSTNLPVDYVVPDVVSKSVKKEWIDYGVTNKRPSSVKVQLYADGIATGSPIILEEKNNWEHNWDNLPKEKDGVDIKYTVKELDVPQGYMASIKENSDGYDFVIENVLSSNLSLSKVVTGNDGDKNKTFTFEISIIYDGYLGINRIFLYEGSVKPGYENESVAPQNGQIEFINGKAQISLSHGQQITIKGIHANKLMRYTVSEKEANQDGYMTTYNGSENIATGSCENDIEIDVENRKGGEIPQPPDTGITDSINNNGMFIIIAIIGLLLTMIGYVPRLRRGLK